MNNIILNILKLCLEAQNKGIRVSFDCNDQILAVWLFDGIGESVSLVERIVAYRGMGDEEHALNKMIKYLDVLIDKSNKTREEQLHE